MTSTKSFLNSVKWAYTANWGERAFSALFTLVLAALLGPRDFGVVAIGMVYVMFLQMFLDQGLMAALIQKKDLEPEHLDAVFWMDLVLSVFLVGTSFLLGGWWAARNHAPEAARLISVLSLCIPIQGLAAVQGAILNRNMDFKALSIRANISVIASGVIGIGMAFSGFGVWSLVGQQISRDLIAMGLLWKLSPWRPHFEFSWKHLKELLGFSVSNFTAQLALFAEGQSAGVFLGLFFGPLAVGLYRLADRLVYSVVAMATTSIQSVSLPEFSRVQDQPEELRKSALACIRLGSLVTLPALSGMAVVSGALMAALGPKWLPASDALKVLCVMGMCTVFACFTGPMLQALSRPHHLALLEWARVAVGTALLIVAGLLLRNSSVSRQLMGIALARTVTMIFLVMPIFLYILMRLCGISLRDITSAAMPSAVASISTVGAVVMFQLTGWLAGGKPLILLIAEIGVGGIAGISVLLALDAHLRGVVVGLQQRILCSLAFSRGV
jgi:O-antigen/teichoic acid export membrane protein